MQNSDAGASENRPGPDEVRPVPPRLRRRESIVHSEPQISISPDILARYNARVLDPTTVVRATSRLNDPRPHPVVVRPTVYIADALLVRPELFLLEGSRKSLEDAAAASNVDLDWGPERDEARQVTDGCHDDVLLEPPRRVRLTTRLVPGQLVAPPADAWVVLQTYLAMTDYRVTPQVSLDHLMMSASGPLIGGSPYVQGHSVGGTPYVQGHGVASSQYGVPGWGGRQPVNWMGAAPARDDDYPTRRPVVAVLDTGVGNHPWLPSSIVRRETVALSTAVANPEITGVTGSPYEGTLDADAGHGTFIAGLIRQQCGDADVLAVPLMGGDGVVAESNLLDVLHVLAARQVSAVAPGGDATTVIDVLSLSLGYYHETPQDGLFDPLLREPLESLGAHGVTVVVAAGNDSTDRPMFPAAFTPWPGGLTVEPSADVLPVISVGALNPNNSIALFSNAGDWVTCHRPGAAVVSTYPITIDGGQQPSSATWSPREHRERSTVDPDNFKSGFAVWSGTSFAAPVLAGQIAAKLCAQNLSAVDHVVARTRGWAAVTACVPELHP